jgi:hypothetical protein
MRCVTVFDLVYYRFIETNQMQKTIDLFLESFQTLYKHHPNPILFVYTTLMYYNSKFEMNKELGFKKRRILMVLNCIIFFLQNF